MATRDLTTPWGDGFRMPAEWEPHAGTWMIWPERTDNWRLGAKPAQQSFAAVAEVIAAFEPVTMIASARQFAHARSVLPAAVRVVEMSTNDSWCRDVGPTFVRDAAGEVRGVDWTFNAWGGLLGGMYFPWDLDDAVASKILELERVPGYRSPLVAEGGAFHVDGAGTAMTTEAVLLNENRNPGWTGEEVEDALQQYLGVERVVWVPEGIPGDETGGHIDDLACFTSPGVVALSWCDDPDDPHHAVSRAAERVFVEAGLAVERLPMPPPMYLTEGEAAGIDRISSGMVREPGERLAASYANFLVINGAVVVPAFDAVTDSVAQEIIEGLFPGRAVIMVPSREILLGGGNIHCITQQQPAPVSG